MFLDSFGSTNAAPTPAEFWYPWVTARILYESYAEVIMSTLLRSQIVCGICDEIIVSIHRHDFQTCSCGSTFLDGGRDYCRVGSKGSWYPLHVSVDADLDDKEARELLRKLLVFAFDDDGQRYVTELQKHGLVTASGQLSVPLAKIDYDRH